MTDSNEERLKARIVAENARMEEHNARVLDWIERTRHVRMSWRKRTDGWAEVMRPQNIEMLEGAERIGWIAPREERASSIQAALCECGFTKQPKSGWPHVCYELDLIFIALPDRVDDRNIGHAGLAKLVEQEAESLARSKSRLQELSCQIDFIWAESQCGSSGKNWRRLNETEQALRRIVEFLKERPQPARWRNAAQRKFRIELATKVSTLFELEFDEEAKPVGGSAARELVDTNNWTRFFQACALIVLGERSSPDRQAVLWEAFGNGSLSDNHSGESNTTI